VVRVDERQEGRRVFLQESQEVVNSLSSRKRAQEYVGFLKSWVKACKPTWKEKWSASVFSDGKYAAYKDEKQVEQFLKDGTWIRNYLVEYDNDSGVLTIYPALPEKKAIHYLSDSKKQ
jgi:hypothetical protein